VKLADGIECEFNDMFFFLDVSEQNLEINNHGRRDLEDRGPHGHDVHTCCLGVPDC